MYVKQDGTGRRLCDTSGCEAPATHHYHVYRDMVGCEKHAVESCKAGRSYGIFGLEQSIRPLREDEMRVQGDDSKTS